VTVCSRCPSLWYLVDPLSPEECVIYWWLFLLVCTMSCCSILGSVVTEAEDPQWASQMSHMVRATAVWSDCDHKRQSSSDLFTPSSS